MYKKNKGKIQNRKVATSNKHRKIFCDFVFTNNLRGQKPKNFATFIT